MALKVVVEIYLTNKHIDNLTLLATSGILTELRFSMKQFPTIGGRCVCRKCQLQYGKGS